ncbi:MAG TPA: hypothetical protein VJ476_03800 [Rhizomicrobium sp.]|nr:hypothetical protein [Rhizomicrobium sp.]
MIYFGVSATDGRFAATQEFYSNIERFTEFGRALTAFPRSIDSEEAFENGSPDSGISDYLLVRAYLRDGLGHGAIEIVTDNGRSNPYRAKAAFNLHCEVAAINRLGVELKSWATNPSAPLVWNAVDRDV